MKKLLASMVLLSSVVTGTVAANELEHPETAKCIAIAAERFDVPETALWLILDVERGTVGRVSQNTNGTVDIGPMQINSWWTEPQRLGRFGITYNDILHDRCLNIYVGTWIFAQEYQRERDIVRAIARYHSPTPEHQHRYLGLIQQAIQRRARRVQSENVATPRPPVAPQSQAIALAETPRPTAAELIRSPTIVAARNTSRILQ